MSTLALSQKDTVTAGSRTGDVEIPCARGLLKCHTRVRIQHTCGYCTVVVHAEDLPITI